VQDFISWIQVQIFNEVKVTPLEQNHMQSKIYLMEILNMFPIKERILFVVGANVALSRNMKIEGKLSFNTQNSSRNIAKVRKKFSYCIDFWDVNVFQNRPLSYNRK